MIKPPKDFPFDVLSCGFGVQSSTLLFMADAGEVGPRPHSATFADTKAETKKLYAWIKACIKRVSIPVAIVCAGDLAKDSLTVKIKRDNTAFFISGNVPVFGKNPDGTESILPRQCTKTFKIEPIEKETRRLAKAALPGWRKKHATALAELDQWELKCKAARALNEPEPHRPEDAWRECQQDALCVQWIGISLDEIIRVKESRTPWIRNRWPLIEMRMTRHDCLVWMQKNGLPEPPRSACFFCPYKSDSEWRQLRDEEPHYFKRAALFERAFDYVKRIGGVDAQLFLHRSLKPLDQVDFETEEEKGQGSLFGNECEGVCGV